MGLNHLALPLAPIRDGERTQGDTGDSEKRRYAPAPPSRRTGAPGALRFCRPPAPGTIARGPLERADPPRGVWVAIPPDAIVDRARDVLDG